MNIIITFLSYTKLNLKGTIAITYSVKVITRDEQLTNIWSGGATTEITIYPENAAYNKLNFKWRISTATVDLQESYFTTLPNIWRLTMVMDGEMLLKHEGHYQVLLKPFEQDCYNGEWKTQSKGKVRNFNLMLAKGCKGELHHLHLEKRNQHERIIHQTNKDFQQVTEAFYCTNNKISIMIDNKESYELLKGDLLLLTRKNVDQSINLLLSNENETLTSVIGISIYF